MGQASNRTNDNRPISAEYIKFGFLVLILMGTLILIALLSPFIFNRVIPIVLGMDPDTTTLSEPLLSPQPLSTVEPQPANPMPSTSSTPAAALESAGTVHVVQEGQSIYRIAIMYGLRVEDIAAANHIVSPSKIDVGTVLVIPQD